MRPAKIKPTVALGMLTCGLLLLPPTGGGCIEAANLLRTLTNPPTDIGMGDVNTNDNGGSPADNANQNSANDQSNDNGDDNQSDDGANDNDNSPNDDDSDVGPSPDDSNMNDNSDSSDDQTPDDSEDAEGVPPLPDDAVLETSATGVQTYDFVVGEGDSPEPGAMVRVAYTGYLEKDGAIFDSNDSVVFDLDNLIDGFTEGVLGMRVGGMRRIIIPPDQGYGAAGNAGTGIGGEDIIIFDVDLLEIP